MINFTVTRNALRLLYTDKMEVYRHTNGLNADGTTITNLPKKSIYTNIPCRISFSRTVDSPSDKAINRNPISEIPKIICDIDVDIKAGDFVIVTRNNKVTYKGLLGLPNMYENHQEAMLDIRSDA